MLPLEVIKKNTVVMMKCPYQQTCKYDTDEDIPKESLVAEKQLWMQLHIWAIHSAPPQVQPAPAAARTEKFPHPKLTLVDGYITEEAWEYFVNNWKSYNTLANPRTSTREILGASLGEVDNTMFARVGTSW